MHLGATAEGDRGMINSPSVSFDIEDLRLDTPDDLVTEQTTKGENKVEVIGYPQGKTKVARLESPTTLITKLIA